MAKVLLVEDDNNLREIYEARLQAEGYDIVSAKDGEEALVVAKEEKPDLIISDVMMPKISGFEMLDILRNTAGLKDTKVIMLTALGQAEDQSRADRLGADKYLVKSQVTLEDIVKVSHELLGDGEQAEEAITTQSTSSTDAPTAVVAVAPVVEPVIPPVPVAPEPIAPPDANELQTQPSDSTNFTTQPNNDAVQEIVDPNATATVDPMPVDQNEIAIDSNGALTQTEAEETATMNQKIDEFLQNVPSTPTMPQAEVITNDDSQPSASEKANDQTLAQAVNNLMSVDSEPSQINETTQSKATTNEPLTQSAKTVDDTESSDISGKKIISPIAGEQKKTLDELMAQEDALEKAKIDIASNQQSASKPFDPSDPNNIAL